MECGLSSPPVTVHFLKSAARDPQVLMLMLRTGAGQHDEAGQPGSCMIHMREVMQPGCMIAWGRVCRGKHTSRPVMRGRLPILAGIGLRHRQGDVALAVVDLVQPVRDTRLLERAGAAHGRK
jgi:hypothetical protein